MSASLADAERRLRLRLGELAFPEQLRQSILACVTAVISPSEATAARVSIDFEQQALAAAAQCGEQCERLPNVSSQQRRALAVECESLFFGLIRSAQRLSEPPARAAGNK